MITQEILKQKLFYNPETGEFTRIEQRNSAAKGAFLGTLQPHGYRTLCVNYKKYYVHRLAWMYTHGAFPINELDHVNGDRSDNRIVNLRLAERKHNLFNTRRRSDNTSGFKGVTWNKDCRKWLAQIQKDGEHFYLGVFDDVLDAARRYNDEALKLFGPFAKINLVEKHRGVE